MKRSPLSRADSLGADGVSVTDPEVVAGREQRSFLYGLLWWKDKVDGRLPAAQFHKRVVKRPDA